MSAITAVYDSTIGKKAVMAITGIVLLGFVFVHMLGNLKIYFGAEQLNHYADWLRAMGAPFLMHSEALWIFRVVLIGAVLLHILAATQLTTRSWSARPVKYARREYLETGYAARTMRWGGVIVLLFVIYHLLDLTFGVVNPAYSQTSVYANIVSSFSRWPVAVFYIVAMVLLCLHIYHGVWSAFRSLGLQRPMMDRLTRGIAAVFAIVIAIGNISIPVAVLAGWVK